MQILIKPFIILAKLKLTLLVIILGFSSFLKAQENEKKSLILFSGIVVTGDSLEPIPYVHILVAKHNYGTVSDSYGCFSFVVQKSDTLVLSAIGYKTTDFVVPDTISKKKYSLLMTVDTLMLPEATIYPWPNSYLQFKEAFLELDIQDDNLEIARKNTNPKMLARMGATMKMDASMIYRHGVQERTRKLYYFGQEQPITILNTHSWMLFIRALKEGKFKRKKIK